MALVQCSACQRHIRATAAVCPFCEVRLGAIRATAPAILGMILGLALAGCVDDRGSSSEGATIGAVDDDAGGETHGGAGGETDDPQPQPQPGETTADGDAGGETIADDDAGGETYAGPGWEESTTDWGDEAGESTGTSTGNDDEGTAASSSSDGSGSSSGGEETGGSG